MVGDEDAQHWEFYAQVYGDQSFNERRSMTWVMNTNTYFLGTGENVEESVYTADAYYRAHMWGCRPDTTLNYGVIVAPWF